MSRVVCVGLATQDAILRVPELPDRDGRVLADERALAGGGPAATAAVTLVRLGVEATLVAAVGDDEAGAAVREELRAAGVDVSAVAVVRGGRTPWSAILVTPDGARTIVHHPGDVRVPDVDPGALADAAFVHVDHAGYSRVRNSQAQLAARLSVDGGAPIDDLDLRGVAVYAPTEGELRARFGDAAGALAAGAELVVATRGTRGCAAYARDGSVIEVPAPPVDVVSTLGAGDVFHGALLAFLVRGGSLEEALRAANAAAALSCRSLDGRSAIPTIDELERRLGRST